MGRNPQQTTLAVNGRSPDFEVKMEFGGQCVGGFQSNKCVRYDEYWSLVKLPGFQHQQSEVRYPRFWEWGS